MVSFSVPSRMVVPSLWCTLTPIFTQIHPLGSAHDDDASGAVAMSDAFVGRFAPVATTSPGTRVSDVGKMIWPQGTSQRPPATTNSLSVAARAMWPKDVVSGSGFWTRVQLKPAG